MKIILQSFIIFFCILIMSSKIVYCLDESKDDRRELKIANSLGAGFLRSLVTLGLEYPSEVVVTRMQSNPIKFYSITRTIKDLYFEQGARGFYQGIMPKISSVFLRNCYQWSILGMCPDLYRDILPKRFKESPLPAILTGISLGIADSFLTPLERWKVFVITSPSGNRENLRQFLKRPQIYKELFKGSNTIFATSTLAWTSFLLINHFTNLHMKKDGEENDVFLRRVFFTTVLVGFTETFITLPFIMLQTQYQKAKDPMSNVGILRGVINIAKIGGVGRLYTGWRLDLSHTLFFSFFDVYLLNYLEKYHSSRVKER